MITFEWILLASISLLLIGMIILYLRLSRRVETRARAIFEEWKQSDRREIEQISERKAEHEFGRWRDEHTERIRRDAIERSGHVMKGKVTEHLAPFFPDFPYHPADARFLGTPVDLIVFDGLSTDEVREIIFLEIKTGKTGALSKRERSVQRCIEAGKVRYEKFHVRSE